MRGLSFPCRAAFAPPAGQLCLFRRCAYSQNFDSLPAQARPPQTSTASTHPMARQLLPVWLSLGVALIGSIIGVGGLASLQAVGAGCRTSPAYVHVPPQRRPRPSTCALPGLLPLQNTPAQINDVAHPYEYLWFLGCFGARPLRPAATATASPAAPQLPPRQEPNCCCCREPTCSCQLTGLLESELESLPPPCCPHRALLHRLWLLGHPRRLCAAALLRHHLPGAGHRHHPAPPGGLLLQDCRVPRVGRLPHPRQRHHRRPADGGHR